MDSFVVNEDLAPKQVPRRRGFETKLTEVAENILAICCIWCGYAMAQSKEK